MDFQLGQRYLLIPFLLPLLLFYFYFYFYPFLFFSPFYSGRITTHTDDSLLLSLLARGKRKEKSLVGFLNLQMPNFYELQVRNRQAVKWKEINSVMIAT